MTTLRLLTSGPDETRAVGAALAELLGPGDVVALSGELGAGKTCLVQGAARHLGVTARVTSPTFVLMRLYDEGRVPVVHCDVYRLERLTDVHGLGDDVLAPDVVTFIEWADAITPLLPDDRLEVDLRHAQSAGVPSDVAGDGDGERADGGLGDGGRGDGGADDGRLIIVRGRGRWQRDGARLVEALAAWRVEVDG